MPFGIRSSSAPAEPRARRPEDAELDYFGITHQGKVRKTNQDQFLIATIHPRIVVHSTSLPDPDALPLQGSRMGTMMLVADGVGGGDDGAEAARLALETVTRYVATTMRCYHTAGSTGDNEFFQALKTAALQAHDAVRAEAAARSPTTRMATTLTLGVGVWPWMYIVQVGDSRAYLFSNNKLTQVTRDQTIAQQLVDEGALAAKDLKRSPLNNVLASAIGAEEAMPVVTRIDVTNCQLLFCSDGLTKHLTDDEIETRMRASESAEGLSRELLQLALDRGGVDNITIVVARRAKGRMR